MFAKPASHLRTVSSVHLDALRAAAALVVLLGHTRDLFFSSVNGVQTAAPHVAATAHHFWQMTGTVQNPITMGDEAVIIFFVLSGYLVGGSAIRDLKRGAWSWKKYLTQRLTRLWIVLIPALLFGIALDHLGLRMFAGTHSIYTGPPGLCIVPCDVAERLSPRVVAGNLFFLQTVFTVTAGSNNALWSLANEFWYYLAFPLGLLAVQRDQPMLRRVLYIAGLATIAAMVGKTIALLFFVWLFGALISVTPLLFPRKALGFATGTLAVFFPVAFVLVRRAYLPRYVAEWAVALSFSALLYLLLHQTQAAPAGIYKSTAGFMSRMSYTLYLVHLPLAIFLCACFNTPWHRWDRSASHLILFLVLNLLLVLFSYAFYLLFEANTDRLRQILFDRHMRELHMTRVFGPRTLIIRSLLPERPTRLLDVGCGPISSDYPYADKALQVTCIDCNVKPMGSLPANVEFVGADFTSIDLARDTYDSVIAADVFEHILLEQEPLFVSKCVAALRPGGRMVLSVPHRGTFACLDPYQIKPTIYRILARLRLYKGVHNGSCDIRKGHKHYSLEELVEKFSDLKVSQVVYFGYFFDPLVSWAIALSGGSGKLPGFSWLQRALRRELDRDYGQRSFNIAVSFYKP